MKRQPSPGCSLALSLGFAGVFALAGAYIIAISFNILPADPERFKAPRLVVAAAGLTFFLAGLWVAFQAGMGTFGSDTPLARWVQYVFSLAILAAFVSVFLWAGFGPGERQFESSLSIGTASTSGAGGEAGGRLLFGAIGLLVAAGSLHYAVSQPFRILGRQPPWSGGRKEGPPPA